MKDKLSAVRWKRVTLAIGVGLAVTFITTTVYAKWKLQNGWCFRYYPDGSEKILYGADCQKPSTHTGIQTLHGRDRKPHPWIIATEASSQRNETHPNSSDCDHNSV